MNFQPVFNYRSLYLSGSENHLCQVVSFKSWKSDSKAEGAAETPGSWRCREHRVSLRKWVGPSQVGPWGGTHSAYALGRSPLTMTWPCAGHGALGLGAWSWSCFPFYAHSLLFLGVAVFIVPSCPVINFLFDFYRGFQLRSQRRLWTWVFQQCWNF